jgi:conjugative relaxase-like TrwC/TraI family protein
VAYYEQDVERTPAEVGTDMTDYYAERGDRPPTVFAIGRTAEESSAAARRLGVEVGADPGRDAIEVWFNEGVSPAGEQLGQPYRPPSSRQVKIRDEAGKVVLDAAGEPVTQTKENAGTVRGWDLTTAAPKSVSLLWALTADAATAAAVEQAHQAASETALAYLAEHAGYTRQRLPGHDQPAVVESGALTGVRYAHRTSRAQEPHLHDHVLVHNRVVNSVTGEWTSLDGTSLMFEIRTAGMVYQSSLRARLTAALGVSWQQVDPQTGIADLAGVNRATIEAWSTRSSEITSWLADRGLSSAAANANGQKATRDPKNLGLSDEQLREQWRDRAQREGLDVDAIGRGPDGPDLGPGLGPGPGIGPSGPDHGPTSGPGSPSYPTSFGPAPAPPAPRSSSTMTPAGLPTPQEVLAEVSRERSTFTRSHAAGAAAALIPTEMAAQLGDVDGRPGRLLEVVEDLADQAIGAAVSLEAPSAQGDTVSARTRSRGGVRGRLYGTREGAVRYATTATIQLEATTTERASARVPGWGKGLATHPGLVPEWTDLSLDQLTAVRSLVSSDRRVSVLIAPAGAGKTTTMGKARGAWEADGRTVHGIAPTGKAAAGLVDEGAAETADTIATVLGKIRRGDDTGWDERDVVLLDEAGMVGSHTLATLIEHAETSGAKLVLIGDPHQLQPVREAGGMFELLADDLPDTVRLGEVWRQVDEGERQATLGLRGDANKTEAAAAIAWYAANDRVVAGDQASMLTAALRDWDDSTRQGMRAMMFAPTWEIADALAAAAQRRQLELGHVDHTRTVDLGDYGDDSLAYARRQLDKIRARHDGQPDPGGRVAGVGDQIMTRRNDYDLVSTAGKPVRNGQTWEITKIHAGDARAGGTVTLTRTGTDPGTGTAETVDVPASYLAQHARLGYAVSIHQSQGVTVDAAHNVFEANTSDQNTVYTAMTRARSMNKAYIATGPTQRHPDDEHAPKSPPIRLTTAEAADLLADMTARGRRDRAAHHVLADAIRDTNAEQARRYDPDTRSAFIQAAAFTDAAKADKERRQRNERSYYDRVRQDRARRDRGPGMGR